MLTTAGEKARARTVLFYHLKVKELVGTLLADVPYPHSGARMDITEGLGYSSPAAKKAWISWKKQTTPRSWSWQVEKRLSFCSDGRAWMSGLSTDHHHHPHR